MSTFLERATADASNIFVGGAGFAVPATFTFNAAAGAKEIQVIFEENFEPTDQFNSETCGAGPVALCAAADVLDDAGNLPQTDATFVIKTVTYYLVKAMHYGDLVQAQLSRDASGGQDKP